jgi:hypothetical protein
MIDFFVGERIARAIKGAWCLDDLNGRLGAVVVVLSVASAYYNGAKAIINFIVN